MYSRSLLILIILTVCHVEFINADSEYTNTWAVEIQGGEEVAERVAEQHGYEIVRKLIAFYDHYVLRHLDVPHKSKRSAHHYTKRLSDDDRVLWAEQQVARTRTKRGNTPPGQKKHHQFNDPNWNSEWYLKDTRNGDISLPKLDLNVLPVWEQGISGHNVKITVLDDGLEHNHTDLARNYDPESSYDLNDDDDDPFPRYDPTNENKHGTRCAGEIAMIKDNNFCGVGVAYNAKIGGVRMLDGTVTDLVEASAIAYNHLYVDVYSASWGPNDDGRTVEGPGRLAKKAFIKGITEGRDGKGAIYAWASGNGGHLSDNCDCDGYTGSIYTISISSASEQQQKPWYAEKCASTMATTYSSGAYNDQRISTTDLHNLCTNAHTGTSAAAPLAAGIFGLVLEANPNITWRDMQHIVVWSAEFSPLQNNSGWKQNSAKFWVNSAFGFGLLNAAKMVEVADKRSWVRVPEKSICSVVTSISSNLPKQMHSHQEVEIDMTTTGCKAQDNEVNFLEHVELVLDMDYTTRGALSIDLVSPSDTLVMLLSERPNDKSDAGFNNWTFMSVHTWGERPQGKWKLLIRDQAHQSINNSGTIKSVKLVLHGTRTKPEHVRRAGGSRIYNYNYNNVIDERMMPMRRYQEAKLNRNLAKLQPLIRRLE